MNRGPLRIGCNSHIPHHRVGFTFALAYARNRFLIRFPFYIDTGNTRSLFGVLQCNRFTQPHGGTRHDRTLPFQTQSFFIHYLRSS